MPSVSPAVPSDRDVIILKTSSGSREIQRDEADRFISGSEDGTMEAYERGRLGGIVVKQGTRIQVGQGYGQLQDVSSEGFLKTRAQGQLTACKSNCKNLATALEMYASDNGGSYPLPGQLDARLTAGNYLKQIPTCPAASTNTYSGTYNSIQAPDSFSFQCAGNNHAKAYSGFAGNPSNYPQYDAEQGLLDHP